MKRLLGLLLLFGCGPAVAAQAHVAVAANFAAPAKHLADRFSAAAGHKLVLSTGSTGKFYAQIKNRAPFDVFLSADASTPQRMEEENLAVPGTRFTYAIGKLVLWSATPGLVDARGEVLRSGTFKRLSIANPRLAPYGAAAREVMEKLGVWQTLEPRLVQGENIAQTFQFVSTRNAELGFVALAQVMDDGKPPAGSHWVVPSSLYSPIRQDAVLVTRAKDNRAAVEFLAFLRSPAARELIRAYGYDLDE